MHQNRANEIGVEERKAIMLAIMDNVDAFCKENGLRYTLSGGSMLGAIRHKGYIPWDDDIDLCMPRKDYEVFISLFNKKKDISYHKLLSQKNDNKYFLPYAKVIDDRTVLIEDNNWKNPMSVGIDVFPLDYCCDTYEESCKYLDSFKGYYWLKNFKLVKISRHRKLWKNVILIMCKIFTIGLSRKTISKRISNKAIKRMSYRKYMAELVNNAYGYREIFPSFWFDCYEEVEFEGRRYCVSNYYKEILEQVFSNYMELPPMEKRTNHNAVSFWK